MNLPGPFDIIRIRIPANRDTPAYLYTPSSFSDTYPAQFSVPIYASCVPAEIAACVVMTARKGKALHGYAKTKMRPEIILDDVDQQYRDLCRLDACNRGRDHVFDNRDMLAYCHLMLMPTNIPSIRERFPNATRSLRLIKVDFRSGAKPSFGYPT